MRFQTPLLPARLIKRYKRFLADCELEDGRVVTAHCPNPGSMMGLAEPGTRIWVEPNDDPKKKLKFAWRLVELGSGFVGIDTSLTNKIVREALEARTIAPLAGYDTLRSEVRYGENSRADFLLEQAGTPDTWLEVKSVTLCRQAGVAEFPDAVTGRGAKHLKELGDQAAKGARAINLFCIQRSDCKQAKLATDIDPTYVKAAAEAQTRGVEFLCYDCQIDPQGITLRDKISI